ncbi:ribosomal protein L35 [Kwoniella newhampshirensis]|uniref:Ribosomal protein L35 n=1 Tax=Kwoniella newhampshirensis TaxID=1651941 RepID=A0AAW0YRK5_9TREE
MSFIPRLFLRPSALAGPSRLPLSPLSPFAASISTSVPSLAGHKVKSHSGSKKRFFANASGMAKAGKAHLNTPLSSNHINRLAKSTYVTKTQAKKLRKLLPYA